MKNEDLLKLYKEYIKIFNDYTPLRNNEELDYNNFKHLVEIFNNLTDLLIENGIIECYGIKHYKVIESGEII